MMDKQQAITWLEQIKVKYIHGGDEQFDDCRRESIDMAIQALRQPQIVRCKECKHWDRIIDDRGHCRNFMQCYNGDLYTDDDWYCGDAEPKDGE